MKISVRHREGTRIENVCLVNLSRIKRTWPDAMLLHDHLIPLTREG